MIERDVLIAIWLRRETELTVGTLKYVAHATMVT